MNVQEVMDHTRDALTVRRVFGDAYEKDGLVIIPVARVVGGGGGGGGSDTDGGEGSGAGFGMTVSPAGVYVIKDVEVNWKPALDANKVIMCGQLVAIVALLVLRAFLKARLASH